jgi:hypothetical protein
MAREFGLDDTLEAEARGYGLRDEALISQRDDNVVQHETWWICAPFPPLQYNSADTHVSSKNKAES